MHLNGCLAPDSTSHISLYREAPRCSGPINGGLTAARRRSSNDDGERNDNQYFMLLCLLFRSVRRSLPPSPTSSLLNPCCCFQDFVLCCFYMSHMQMDPEPHECYQCLLWCDLQTRCPLVAPAVVVCWLRRHPTVFSKYIFFPPLIYCQVGGGREFHPDTIELSSVLHSIMLMMMPS